VWGNDEFIQKGRKDQDLEIIAPCEWEKHCNHLGMDTEYGTVFSLFSSLQL
jgi:hypothetical protein